MNAQDDVATQCLDLSVQGKSLRAIGRELGLHPTVVKRHLNTFSVTQVLAAQRRALGEKHVQALDRLNAAIARMNEDGLTAPCSVDPQLWDGRTQKDVHLASWECRRCAARDECREVGRFEKQGVWGGVLAKRITPSQETLFNNEEENHYARN